MAFYRQPVRDYAKANGMSAEAVEDQIREGKLEGVEDDGVMYVRFEIDEPHSGDRAVQSNGVGNAIILTFGSIVIILLCIYLPLIGIPVAILSI